jgi:hypothetical protein
MPALGRPQVAIVLSMRSAHIHRPTICVESGRKYRLKKPQRGFAFASLFGATIWQTPPNARREAGRQRRWFRPFAVTKGLDRQGETTSSCGANAVGTTRFEERRQNEQRVSESAGDLQASTSRQ